MKRMLISLMTITLVAALMGAGVFAYFQDVENASSNTFTAGTLNLKVGSQDPCTETISVANIEPGNTGNAATWLVRNDGSLAGNLTLAIGAITNNENSVSEVEIAAGESPSNTIGDLGGLLKIAVWMDANKNGNWDSGDYYLKSDGTKVPWASGSSLPSQAYATVNSYGSKTWTGCQNVGATTDAGNFRVEYNFPDSGTNSDNVAQSDSCVFNITFTLNQV